MKVAGGRANWWLPGFLRRVLPEIRLESALDEPG